MSYFSAQTGPRYDFLVNAVWPSIVQKLEDELPAIFAPGNPNTLYEVGVERGSEGSVRGLLEGCELPAGPPALGIQFSHSFFHSFKHANMNRMYDFIHSFIASMAKRSVVCAVLIMNFNSLIHHF